MSRHAQHLLCVAFVSFVEWQKVHVVNMKLTTTFLHADRSSVRRPASRATEASGWTSGVRATFSALSAFFLSASLSFCLFCLTYFFNFCDQGLVVFQMTLQNGVWHFCWDNISKELQMPGTRCAWWTLYYKYSSNMHAGLLLSLQIFIHTVMSLLVTLSDVVNVQCTYYCKQHAALWCVAQLAAAC